MSYYDVDAILTEAQKLPCKFELDVPGLGYLDGNAGASLKAGTKIDLPLWLGFMLALSSNPSSQNLVSLDFPPPLQQRVINALKADPVTVDLRAQASHFYSLGARLLDLFEEDDIVDVLTEAFRTRAAKIADHAHNAGTALSDGGEFLRSLDETERKLFRAVHDGDKGVKTWTAKIKNSH